MLPSTEWNSLVPSANRFYSPNRNARKPASLNPSHIVVHVAGTDSLASVKKTFTAANGRADGPTSTAAWPCPSAPYVQT